MTDIPHFRVAVLGAEVATDGACCRLERIRRSEQVADAGDDAVTFEGEGDDGRLLHEASHLWEEGLVGDVGVVLSEDLVAECHHFDTADDESLILKTSEHLADDVFLNRVGLEKDKSGF